MELWKVVGKCPTYEVSTYGNIRHIKHKKNRVLCLTGDGYYKVTLVSNGTAKTFKVARLVAEAFVSGYGIMDPFCNVRDQVDHIDSNRCNDVISNLRWASALENINFIYGRSTEDIRQLHTTHRKIKIMRICRKLLKKYDGIMLERQYINGTKQRPIVYGSIAAMVAATGKAITIDGIKFNSAGAGAQYIVDAETSLGNTRNKATISKELRRFLQGKRDAWLMYDTYSIGY